MSLDIYLINNKCECCGRSDQCYRINITHNLGQMASKANIYNILWRPDENNITTAKQIIEPLSIAIANMKSNPDYFRQYDAPNGWGTYDCFIPKLEEYLNACRTYPNALIEVSR